MDIEPSSISTPLEPAIRTTPEPFGVNAMLLFEALTIVSITGDVKTLFVKVSLPASVAKVPEFGSVTFVVPAVVNVNA